jgi:hypothetical protein
MDINIQTRYVIRNSKIIYELKRKDVDRIGRIFGLDTRSLKKRKITKSEAVFTIIEHVITNNKIKELSDILVEYKHL